MIHAAVLYILAALAFVLIFLPLALLSLFAGLVFAVLTGYPACVIMVEKKLAKHGIGVER